MERKDGKSGSAGRKRPVRPKAATGGDDYELAMTLPDDSRPRLEEISAKLATPLTVIGRVVGNGDNGPKVRCIDDFGKGVIYESVGFNHFSRS